MRIDLKKFLFIGLKEERESFFQQAQKLGMIDFIDTKISGVNVRQETSLIADAIKILRGIPALEQLEIDDLNGAEKIAEKIVSLKQEIDLCDERMRVTELDISRISIFGSFHIEDVTDIRDRGHRVIQFYCGKKGVRDQLAEEPNLVYIASDHGLDYFAGINSALTAYPGLVEMKIDRSLSALKQDLQDAQREKHRLEKRLHEMAVYSTYLHHAFYNELNHRELKRAEAKAESTLEGALFAATGWVPEKRIDSLKDLAKDLAVHVEEVAPAEGEMAPTYLENENLGRMGEDLVGIYDTPSNTDNDPSIFVLFGFLLFFAIIVGDGGYGSVYLGLALYIRYKYPLLKGLKKRLLNLFTMLCVACIGWGLLTSSFFGVVLPPDNPLRKVSLVTFLAEKKVEYHANRNDRTYQSWVKEYPQLTKATKGQELLFQGYTEKDGVRNYSLLAKMTDQILLEIALVIGVVHIMIGMIRYLPRNYPNIGWIIFLVGSLLYFPSYLQAPSFINYWWGVPLDRGGEIGLQLIGIGIPSAIGLSIFKNGLLGLTEVMNLIQVFADVLSYLRLYALGLSGSIVSATINDVASMLPLLLGIVLMAIGHMVNMLLGIMGGVIHGLRLNFLEWYHYSFEGGGKKFKPLEIKQIE
jgi:V/A-type H+-transporting ATPase subunit I